MQVITILAALFATSALAAPNLAARQDDFDAGDNLARPGWNDNNRGNNWNNGRGGNGEGRYQSTCTCVSNGREDQRLGQAACQDLNRSYPNLNWNGRGCVDYNGQGVEYNGFRRACEQVRGGNWNVDARCY